MLLSREVEGAATTAKWLTVVGIGEDGVAGLGERARELVNDAAFVFGGRRHLALAAPLIAGEARPWPEPFDVSFRDIVALAGSKVCVLASGDPLHFGVGATLLRHIGANEMEIIPAPSTFSLAASRLGWPLQDVETVSLHGRPIELVRPLLHPNRRIIALTSDEHAPSQIARLLSDGGFGASSVHVLEALGGQKAGHGSHRADEIGAREFDALNVLCIEVVADPGARVVGLAAGLDDSLFEHDGQITKREIRAVTLSALQPRRGELLWDIGAGSGSVGIEWMLSHPSMRAIAIERDAERCGRIGRNATALGVPGLKVIPGNAPAALAGLPRPDTIFVGGGGSDPGVMHACIDALGEGGRLVANAVTLEMEAVLLDLQARLGGSLIRLSIARAEPVGAMTGWRAAMPVTQWAWTKP